MDQPTYFKTNLQKETTSKALNTLMYLCKVMQLQLIWKEAGSNFSQCYESTERFLSNCYAYIEHKIHQDPCNSSKFKI